MFKYRRIFAGLAAVARASRRPSLCEVSSCVAWNQSSSGDPMQLLRFAPAEIALFSAYGVWIDSASACECLHEFGSQDEEFVIKMRLFLRDGT